MKSSITLVIFIFFLPVSILAQYRSDKPLEMSFEQSQFFFNPSFLNPQGAEHFQEASVLISDDPLNGLQRNPANLSNFNQDTLPGNYFYLDFRNNRDIINDKYHGYHLYDYSFVHPRWGYYHTTNRGELTPLVSIGYLSKLPVLNQSVSLGVTYQLINQAEEYYAIPQDIYRNLAGKDNYGATYEGMSDYEIVDRYSATDDMYHEGHAINTFLSWKVNKSLNIGVKAGTFLFSREGSFGKDNLWNDRIDYYSFWKKHENRKQDYGHWDYSLGLAYTFNETSRLGFYAGFLTGDVTQELNKDDESLSRTGDSGSSSWSDYQSWHISDQDWDHEGNTIYSGLQWNKRLKDNLNLRMMYNFSYLSQELGLKSTIESESNNEYHYESTNYFRESEGYSDMYDYRNGHGERTISKNSFQSALSWQVMDKHNFNVGIILGLKKQQTNTSEKVDAFSETYHYSQSVYESDTNRYEYYYLTDEDKTINWKFQSSLRTLQIPVIYEYQFNPRFNLLVGINRKMSFWKIENTTLVLYDYRRRKENDETVVETMTGERVSEPDERISLTSTNFLFGITFSPVPMFSVQLLASPGIEEHSLMDEKITGTQYWLNVKFRL